MMPHTRLWWFILLFVVFLILATALGATSHVQASPNPAPAPSPWLTSPEPAPPADVPPSEDLRTVLAAKLLLHVIATIIALRLGMKVFYESAMVRGFLAIVAIDTLVTAVMIVVAPLSDGFTALLGPQLVVTGLVMIVTLHRYGFTKDRFTVIPTVLVTKAFGFFGEVALRLVFLDALLRWAALRGW
ncbi:MAG TPA: hypothetical protein VK178_16730 [Opitutaceae bacterium]|nr:hypothetical protein [Opitutaceae bacterium]